MAIGNPSGERLPEFSLANSVEGLSDLCEVPIEFVSTVEEALEIVEEEKEKKRIKDEKAALKEAKRLEKLRLREERMANQGSDDDEDDDDDDEEEEEEEEEEEDGSQEAEILVTYPQSTQIIWLLFQIMQRKKTSKRDRPK